MKTKKNTSLYKQLINSIKKEISTMNKWDKIPSERQLCDLYQISRTTVRNAITDLVHDGFLIRVQGKGTFVQKPNIQKQNLSKYFSFTDMTKKSGKIPKTIILEYHINRANEELSSILNVHEDDLIIKFIRLRLSNNEPMLLETTFIKYDDFSNITKKLLEEMPLYKIYELKYNRKINKVRENMSVVLLNDEQSLLLRTKVNTPCLKILRYSYDENEKIVEYTESYAPGDKFVYETTYFPK